jgi:hypothetical protein
MIHTKPKLDVYTNTQAHRVLESPSPGAAAKYMSLTYCWPRIILPLSAPLSSLKDCRTTRPVLPGKKPTIYLSQAITASPITMDSNNNNNDNKKAETVHRRLIYHLAMVGMLHLQGYDNKHP